MNKHTKKRLNVPMITNLVAAGDPDKKAHATKSSSNSLHLDGLNRHINEIENAIGQEHSDPVGRATAIRTEASKVTKNRPAFMTDINLKKPR